MANLFNMDGLMYKICTVISQLMSLTFYWILFSLPVVTLGASTLALFSVSMKLVNKEDISVSKVFYTSFKTQLRSGILLTVILLILIPNIIYMSFSLLINMSGNYHLMIWNIVYIVEVLGFLLFMITLMSQYDMPIFHYLKSAFLISNLHLLTTCTGILIMFILGYVFFKSPLIVIIVGPAIFSFIWCQLSREILGRYE